MPMFFPAIVTTTVLCVFIGVAEMMKLFGFKYILQMRMFFCTVNCLGATAILPNLGVGKSFLIEVHQFDGILLGETPIPHGIIAGHRVASG